MNTAVLTTVEHQVYTHLVDGMEAKEIGQALHIAHGTVRKHTSSILQKLGVPTSRKLIARHYRELRS